jgi:chemotaxis protein MotB
LSDIDQQDDKKNMASDNEEPPLSETITPDQSAIDLNSQEEEVSEDISIPVEEDVEERDVEECPPCVKGAPAWMATFADMATLLMAFFVLILSFAHVNVPKFKEVSGSMKFRFGVQTVVPIIEAPTADNIIAQQYRQNTTEPTPVNEVEEQRSREEQSEEELDRSNGPGESNTNATSVEVNQLLAKEIAEGQVEVVIEQGRVIIDALDNNLIDGKTGKIEQDTLLLLAKVAAIQSETDALVRVKGSQFISAGQSNVDESSTGSASSDTRDQLEQIKANLSNEISQGLAEVFREGDLIVIRLTEQGSFQSGSASLQDEFSTLLDNVGASLTGTSGLIQVEGHTDNVAMSFGNRYRDNWDLSSARAAIIADYFLDAGYITPGNVVIKGLSDTKPISSNDTAIGRSSNRRIEVIVLPN